MRDKHEGAGKLQKAFFQHVQSRNIQIIGRLIENEQVRRLEHQPGNQQPCLLSTGQPGYGQVQLFRTKEKSFCPGDQMNRPILIDDRVTRRR